MSRSICAFAMALSSVAAAATEPLELEQAESSALANQPLIEAGRAGVRAARERSVAVRQLPDPMLVAGVTNVPVDGEERFSLSSERMTMSGVGLKQEFPGAAKRRLRGKTESLRADEREAQLAVIEGAVRRDTALAYLDVWHPERAAELTDSLMVEAERERDAVAIAFRAGRVPQAEVFGADVELELLRDRVAMLEQQSAEAREQLARWVGGPVDVPVAADVPRLPAPPELEVLMVRLREHPELLAAHADIAAHRTAVSLAREDYVPDWRVEAKYGWRPDFSDMVTLQFGIDLPVFGGQRQDRRIAAAREDLASAEAMHEDHERRLRASASGAYQAWTRAAQRLERYDALIVPRAQARAEAALAAYRAGKTGLPAVLDARRSALDVSLMRLELQVEILRRLAELRYLNSAGA